MSARRPESLRPPCICSALKSRQKQSPENMRGCLSIPRYLPLFTPNLRISVRPNPGSQHWTDIRKPWRKKKCLTVAAVDNSLLETAEKSEGSEEKFAPPGVFEASTLEEVKVLCGKFAGLFPFDFPDYFCYLVHFAEGWQSG